MSEFDVETAAAWLYDCQARERWGIWVAWDRVPEGTKNDYRRLALGLLEQLDSFQSYRVSRRDKRFPVEVWDAATRELRHRKIGEGARS